MVGKIPQMIPEAPFTNERNRITRPWYRFLQLLRDNVISMEGGEANNSITSDAVVYELQKSFNDIIALSSVPSSSNAELDEQSKKIKSIEGYHPPVVPVSPVGIIIERVSSYTTTVTLKIDEGMIFLDASGGVFTVTLPFAAGAKKRVLRLKRTEAGANAITIASQVGDNVDGAATFVIPGGSLGFVDLVSDGSDWWVIG